jgi:hypothetical protein
VTLSVRHVVALSLACLLAALVAPHSAFAESWSDGDRRGDVVGTHFEPEPEPCGTTTPIDASANTTNDMRRLSVDYAGRFVMAKVRFEDLKKKGGHVTSVTLRTDRHDYEATVIRYRSRVDVSVTKVRPLPPPPDGQECYSIVRGSAPCYAASGGLNVRRDFVRIRVPRSCLGQPAWVKAGARSYSLGGSDFYDDSYSFGTRQFGPRVHRN